MLVVIVLTQNGKYIMEVSDNTLVSSVKMANFHFVFQLQPFCPQFYTWDTNAMAPKWEDPGQ